MVAFSSLVASEDRAPTVSADRIQKLDFADQVLSDEIIECEKHVIFDVSEWNHEHFRQRSKCRLQYCMVCFIWLRGSFEICSAAKE